jgi:hydroxypyruvate isomerase
MPRFAANLSLLYNEHPFVERFSAAAEDGFAAVEFLFPYAFDAQTLRQQLDKHALKQVLFNASPGNWEAGERGLACLKGREKEFQSSIVQALSYAQTLDCQRIHVMAGIPPCGQDREEVEDIYCRNIQWAAQKAHQVGVDILIEPINTRDMPGYFLNYQADAHRLIENMNAPNIKVQMDLYHCQIMEGDIATKIRRYLPTGRVGHIQIAGVPLRNEPNFGELNYSHIFEVLDEVASACNWLGWIGCEYRPVLGEAPGATSRGLEWLKNI